MQDPILFWNNVALEANRLATPALWRQSTGVGQH